VQKETELSFSAEGDRNNLFAAGDRNILLCSRDRNTPSIEEVRNTRQYGRRLLVSTPTISQKRLIGTHFVWVK
jgi:hypothetical protein